MNKSVHNLLQDLEDKLKYLSDADALIACREACAKLSGYMEQYAFVCRNEEILYFKIFKPRFMAHRLRLEVLVSGENMEEAAVTPAFRAYYRNGEKKADSIYFSFRSCRKTDFDLPVRACSPTGWEAADKQVARLIVEEWFKNVYA